jgi:hypothetical protein
MFGTCRLEAGKFQTCRHERGGAMSREQIRSPIRNVLAVLASVGASLPW